MDNRTSAQVDGGARLGALFAPRTVAVVGASAEANAVTSRPLRFLKAHGFRGGIYAVNPRHERIDDVACYPAIGALPQRPDVAMVGVSAARLEAAVAECVAAGIPLVSIFTAAVEEGAKRRIVDLARRGGVRVLGPNSLGFIDAHQKIVCTYSQAALLRRIPRGGLSIISQSGGLGGCLLNRAVDAGLGVARFLTPGAGVDIDARELIEMLAECSTTKVVAAILESISDGVRFLEAVGSLHQAGKRLVMWRIGRSDAGRAAAVSHTGAFAADERVFTSLCRDRGVLQVGSIDELLEVAGACAAKKPPKGNAVGIVTSSGGAAIMVADALEAAGLTMPAPSAQTVSELRRMLPPTASISNPLDLGAGQGAQTFRTGLHAMLCDPAFDCIVLALTMVAGDQAQGVLPALIRSTKSATRPLAVVWPAGSLAAAWRRRLRSHGLAVFERPEFAAAALRLLQRNGQGKPPRIGAPSAAAATAAAAFAARSGVQTEWRTRRLLAMYGIESPQEWLAQERDQATAAARRIGCPVALKLQSPLLPHRAQAGALALGLADEEAVARSFDQLISRQRQPGGKSLEGVLVQAMVEPEHEVFVGMVRDPAFGPVIACGPGGSDLEQGEGIEFILPTSERAALESWIRNLAIGARIGPLGVASMAEFIAKLSQLVVDFGPSLLELDINPVALVEGGARALALDALAVIAKGADEKPCAGKSVAVGAIS